MRTVTSSLPVPDADEWILDTGASLVAGEEMGSSPLETKLGGHVQPSKMTRVDVEPMNETVDAVVLEDALALGRRFWMLLETLARKVHVVRTRKLCNRRRGLCENSSFRHSVLSVPSESQKKLCHCSVLLISVCRRVKWSKRTTFASPSTWMIYHHQRCATDRGYCRRNNRTR